MMLALKGLQPLLRLRQSLIGLPFAGFQQAQITRGRIDPEGLDGVIQVVHDGAGNLVGALRVGVLKADDQFAILSQAAEQMLAKCSRVARMEWAFHAWRRCESRMMRSHTRALCTMIIAVEALDPVCGTMRSPSSKGRLRRSPAASPVRDDSRDCGAEGKISVVEAL